MKIHKKSLIAFLGMCSLLAPSFINAQQVVFSAPNRGNTLALFCYDFKSNVKTGDSGEAIRRLQYFLQNEGFAIDWNEYGFFDETTFGAIKGFQEKYKNEVLSPAGFSAGTGFVGKATRAKLNSLYGCGAVKKARSLKLNFGISSLSLDSNGVNVTFCNKSKNDIPFFPARLRLNGVIRDFEVPGAHAAGVCDTESFGYGVWGLTYDPGSTYAVVGAIDPNGFYKGNSVNIPPYGTASTTLTISAISGVHLSVRHVELKANGFQGTFCNLGTVDLTSYPVLVTVNGKAQNFDVPEAYKAGKCQVVTWGYDKWGLAYTPGAQFTASVVVDPNNIYQETNEFDNSATIVGTP